MELVPFRHWIVARAGDGHPAIRFEAASWSYREAVGPPPGGRWGHVATALEEIPADSQCLAFQRARLERR